MKRKKQEIQMHRKEDSIGSERTWRIKEINHPCRVPYNSKFTGRDVPVDRIKTIEEENGYEYGKSFCRVSSNFRNIFQYEYQINGFDDPMTDDLNLRFYRFGSTLVWTFPDPQITNDFNLGHTIPFESLAFSESILSDEISPFGHTRIIRPIEIILGHTNQIPACMLGHTRPF